MSTTFCHYRVRFISADGTVTDPWATPLRVQFGGSFGEPESCTVVLPQESHLFSLEESSTEHATLLRSKMEVYRVTDKALLVNTLPPPWLALDPEWQGAVFFKPVAYEQDGITGIAVTAMSKMHALHATLASLSGDSLGAVETPLRLIRELDGTATNGSPSNTVLEDSGALFESAHLSPGTMVLNVTKAAPTWVATVDSDTQITTTGLASPLEWESGDEYRFFHTPVDLVRVENGTDGTALPVYAWFPQNLTQDGPEPDAFETTTFTGISTTISDDASSSVAYILAQTTHGGFSATGFIRIESEDMHYDGYDNDWPESTVVGTTTGGSSTTVLIDSGATFQADDVQPGWLIANVTKGLVTTVVSVDSETQLTCVALPDSEDWDTGNSYATGATPVYRFKHLRRGAFGTTAAAHVATITIRQLKPLVIGPRAGIILEKRIESGMHAGKWIPLGDAEFVTHAQRGFFEMSYDVLAGGGAQEAPFDALRARYAVYDAEHADAIAVGPQIRRLLEASRTAGGPGWASGTDYAVDALLDDIVLHRHTLREPRSTYEAVQDLLAEAGLSTGSGAAADAVSMVDRHTTGELLVGFVQQKADDVEADTAISSTVTATFEYSLDTIYTAINVLYAPTGGVRLAVPGRTWHPQAAQNPMSPTSAESFLTMGNARAPYAAKIVKQEVEQGNFGTWDNDYTDQDGGSQNGSDNRYTGTGHRVFVDKLFDGLGQTGWGIVGPAFPVGLRSGHLGPCDVLVGWHYVPGVVDTDETPQLAVVEAARLLVDLRASNQSFGPAHVQLVGIPSMTVRNDVPSYLFDDCVPLGIESAFSRDYPVAQTGYRALAPYGAVDLQSEGIDLPLRGWALRFVGGPTRNIDGDNWRYFTAKHLEVLGRPRETAYVQLTANPGGAGTDFYLPQTYTRLRSNLTGEPRVLTVDIGTASRQEAISIGRVLLAQSLAHLGDMRITARDCLGPLPLCGLHTIDWIDALEWTGPDSLAVQLRRGIALERDITWDASGETINLVLRNYRLTSADILH